ncbi:hypothetical protein Tco_0437257, partial [Tanacetum coccineum]
MLDDEQSQRQLLAGRDILLRSAELQEIKTTRTRKAQQGSDQIEEGPNYALMVFSSSSPDSE